MKAAEEHLLIFEGASAGRYPQRSRPSEQRSNDERREPRRSPPKEGSRRDGTALREQSAVQAVRRTNQTPGRVCGRERCNRSPKGATASREGSGINPSGDGEAKNRQMLSAQRVAEITGRVLCWLRGYSPLRGCAREAALPPAHCLPGRCFASATAFRNGLYAI
jgi:hypothetical protein